MEEQKFEIRQHKIEHILGKTPNIITRVGITVIAIIFGSLLIACHYFTYPDILTAGITLASEYPSAEILSPNKGQIAGIFVANETDVKKGDLVGFIENPAKIGDIMLLSRLIVSTNLDSVCQSIDNLQENLQLGTCQTAFKQLRQDIRNKNKISALHRNPIKVIEEQIAILEKTNKTRQTLELLKLKQDLFGLQKTLFIQQQESDQIIRKDIIALQLQIGNWKENFLLYSPQNGKISFNKIFITEQHVNKGDLLFTVSPAYSGKITGSMKISSVRENQIKTGQEVNIKLDHYPYMEYGILKGQINSIHWLPSESTYQIEVNVPESLTSSYGKKITLFENMKGKADIITANHSLLDRIISPLKRLLG